MVGVGLVGANVGSSRGLGIGRGVYCDVTYLEGVQSVKVILR
jgi:hypothetical protein